MKAPPNVIATLIRRHFNGLRGPPVVGTPNATHEGIASKTAESFYFNSLKRQPSKKKWKLRAKTVFSAR
jgi:hypothetical protein